MMTETITEAMAGLGFEPRDSGFYAMYVLGELMLCRAERTPEGVEVSGNIMHRDPDGELATVVHTAERAERTRTHDTIGEATEAAAMLVAAELLGPTLVRADELLRKALATYLPSDLQGYCGRVSFGFAVDHHDYVESPDLELTIVGVAPMVEREAILPDVALYPGDLTAARIIELGEALAETIGAWERGELW